MNLLINFNFGRFFALLFLIELAGCAVGPDFKKPAAPNVTSYTAVPTTNIVAVTNVLGGEAQRFVSAMDISGQWWVAFHSKPLNDLIDRAIKASPNLQAARSALLVARENVLSQRGAYLPSAAASFSASREHQSAQLSPAPNINEFLYSLYTPEVAISYSPDVFGLNRRTVESLQAQSEQQRFVVAATYITLTANVVAAVINEASLRSMIQVTTNLIGENTKALGMLRAQLAAGYAGGLDVAAQATQLSQVLTTLPPLQKQLAQQRDALAVLVGAFPSEDPGEKFELSSLHLPEVLPLSLPSKLVAQRPDVRQAEETMHAYSAQIGIAVANRLPNITLTANAGSTALALDQIFSSGTGFWGVGGQITQPLFQGGALLHKQRAAQAAYDAAAAQYRSTVLTAFQNVADTLNALEQDGHALKAAVDAEQAAQLSFNLVRNRLQSGYANFFNLFAAETAYQQSVITLVQAQASRYADTAALFQALGGGWWNSKDLTQK